VSFRELAIERRTFLAGDSVSKKKKGFYRKSPKQVRVIRRSMRALWRVKLISAVNLSILNGEKILTNFRKTLTSIYLYGSPPSPPYAPPHPKYYSLTHCTVLWDLCTMSEPTKITINSIK
jgi:hypothetical protein